MSDICPCGVCDDCIWRAAARDDEDGDTQAERDALPWATPPRCTNPNCGHPESEHQSACWACRRVGNTCPYFAAPTPEASAPRCESCGEPIVGIHLCNCTGESVERGFFVGAAPAPGEPSCVVCGRTASERVEDDEHQLTRSGGQSWHCAPLTGCAVPERHAFDLAAMREAFDLRSEDAAIRVVREHFGSSSAPPEATGAPEPSDARLLEVMQDSLRQFLGVGLILDWGDDLPPSAIDATLAVLNRFDSLRATVAALTAERGARAQGQQQDQPQN